MTARAEAIPDALDASTRAGKQAARRRWWLLVSLTVIAPLLLILTGVLTAWAWLAARHAAAMRELNQEVARIQASGEPITTDDLYAYHRVPAGTKDITALWTAAFDSLNESQFSEDKKGLPVIGDRNRTIIAAQDLTACEKFLATHDATVLATLAAAQADGECRFPVTFGDAFGMLIPHADKLQNIGRLMRLRGRVAIERNYAEQAIESIDGALATSETLRHHLTLVEQLVRQKIAAEALAETEYLLNEADLTDDQLARLAGRIDSLDWQVGLADSVMGERAMSYSIFHHPEQIAAFANATSVNGLVAIDPPAAVSPDAGKINEPLDCKLTLDLHRQVREAAKEPFPKALDELHRTEERLHALQDTIDPVAKHNSRITLMIFPAYSTAFEGTGSCCARRDLTRCALAAERHRLARGELPAKLDDLVPEFLPAVPTDAFDGQPLRMKASDEVLLIYSVGKDRKDDGGMEQDNRAEPDIVVTLTRRKK